MEKPYKINEKDIESVIRWLKVNDPENATRDKAIALLKDLKAGFHGMAHNNPELLAKLKQELDSNRTQG
ncbi:hypothetical protein TM7_0231 [candidate division TM7 genomosp. GTL1]|nr:hypothetical protein TM7_0616 [candidate division TM7 genomosp. GTL1]EDK72889.1 hypothetical protein TM7_0231 [candidate division TM7 genomosp. GTL1]